VFFLARDTVTRPGDCLETLQLQFLFALHTGSEFVVLDALQRFVNQLQHGPIRIGLTEQEFLCVRVGSLVGQIDRWIIVSGPTFFFGARDAFQQLLAPRAQPFLVILKTLLIYSHSPTILNSLLQMGDCRPALPNCQGRPSRYSRYRSMLIGV
jgi:hypothetical protein